MAHHEEERNTMHGVLDMLVEQGLEGVADAMATMLNEVMKIERSAALGAEPGERSDNGLIFQSRRFREACREYRIKQEFITPLHARAERHDRALLSLPERLLRMTSS